jgi:hypothetical protein
MSSEHLKSAPSRDRQSRLQRENGSSKTKVLAVYPELWCEAIMAGHDVTMGYRIRDRGGQLFGFAYKRRAAWQDAWWRIRTGIPPEGPGG